jgi:basic amino acid/polyamine antiporter, APA family
MSASQRPQGQLVQSLAVGAATVLVVSSVIGSGVYKKVAPMTAALGSPALVLLAWILAGIVSLFGALSNAEIAGMLAQSGGEYAYFKRIYGKFMAFIYGWSVFTVIKSAAVASIAYVFSQSLNSIIEIPHFNISIESYSILGIFKPFENFGVKSLTILLILSLSFLNTRGLKGGSWLSGNLTKLIVLGLVIIIISGLFFGGGSLHHFHTVASSQIAGGMKGFSMVKAMFGAMLAAFWAYEGWNIIGFMGGEILRPKRNIPLALFGGMAIVMAVYTLVNFTYLYVLPVDKLIDVYKSQNQIAAVEVLRQIAGASGAFLLSLLILATTLGCTNSTILMPPRIYQAMASDRLFFRRVAEIHPKYNTPNNALWIQAFWASLLVLSGSFDQLTDMLIFIVFFFYGATAMGVFIMRIREPLLERTYKVWGYPIVPALFVLFCICLIIITCFTNPREAGLGFVLVLTGIPFYLYWNRKQNVKM